MSYAVHRRHAKIVFSCLGAVGVLILVARALGLVLKVQTLDLWRKQIVPRVLFQDGTTHNVQVRISLDLMYFYWSFSELEDLPIAINWNVSACHCIVVLV